MHKFRARTCVCRARSSGLRLAQHLPQASEPSAARIAFLIVHIRSSSRGCGARRAVMARGCGLCWRCAGSPALTKFGPCSAANQRALRLQRHVRFAKALMCLAELFELSRALT